jgi:hypothetical protein
MPFQYGSRTVFGTIIDDQKLEVVKCLVQNTLDGPIHIPLGVINRHGDGNGRWVHDHERKAS